MIADSREVKEWDLAINLEPDQIEAKILKRPGIIMGPGPAGPGAAMQPPTTKSLDDTNILRQIVS